MEEGASSGPQYSLQCGADWWSLLVVSREMTFPSEYDCTSIDPLEEHPRQRRGQQSRPANHRHDLKSVPILSK